MPNEKEPLTTPAVYQIMVDGQEIDALYVDLQQLTVELSRSRAGIARIEFSTVRQADGSWNVVDSGLLAPWKQITIKLVLAKETQTLFKGFICDVVVAFSTEVSGIVVNCQDESLMLDREHVCCVWGDEDEPITDLAIVNIIAEKYNLKVDGQEGCTHESLAQDCTDIRFIKQRSEANGFELILQNGQIYFGPARVEDNLQKTIVLGGGIASNCTQLILHDDGYKPEKIKTMTLDKKNSSEDTLSPIQTRLGNNNCENSTCGLVDFSWKLSSQGKNGEALAVMAQAKADENSWKISATGNLDSVSYGGALLIGSIVKIEGIGERYSGLFYVDEVTHLISSSGYSQQFKVLKNALDS